MVEDNRNWTLLAAHLSFLSLASLNMSPEPLCQTFSVLIHFLYLTFFSWTAIYGFLFYEDLVMVFSTRKNLKIFYIIGYCMPLTVCLVMFLTSALGGYDWYLRRGEVYHLDQEDWVRRGKVEACYLSVEAVWALVVPAGAVSFINLYLALRVVMNVTARHWHGRTSYVRNMLILSLLLGVTWCLAVLPPYPVVQYLTVLLDGLTGVYILGRERCEETLV